MRTSHVILFSLAALVASSSGCKLGSKRRLIAPRVASNRTVNDSVVSRETAECDCYTCRTKRESEQNYLIDSIYDSADLVPNQQLAEPSITTTPVVDPTVVETNSMDLTTPDIQQIQGQVIEDSELTNELPAEPAVEFEPTTPVVPQTLEVSPEATPIVQPSLSSPQTKTKQDRESELPVVESTPIPTRQVSNQKEITDSSTNEPAFSVNPRTNSVFDRKSEFQSPQPKRNESIWFAPSQSSDSNGEVSIPKQILPKSTRAETIKVESIRSFKIKPTEKAQPFTPPLIEHEVHEIKKPKASDSIVLKAHPVDQHLIYNSRQPIHAPVREARLIRDGQVAMRHRQPVPDRTYFQPLPPAQQLYTSPAPAPVTPLPTANRPNEPQQVVRPVPKQSNHSSGLKMKARPAGNVGQASDAPSHVNPMARVIQPNTPMLKLNALPTAESRQEMPSVFSIQRLHQDQVVIGSLQTPGSNASDRSNSTDGQHANRLHTTPWKPMQTGSDEVGQVQQSIRNLMIQPQQEANFATDGIHR